MEGTRRICETVKVMKILNISNSHGIDSVWHLPLVLKTEKPKEKFRVVQLYQAYALSEHIRDAKENVSNYYYYVNSGDSWYKSGGFSLKMALKAEKWDIIMFNESSRHLGLEEKMSQDMVEWFRQYILDHIDYEPMLFYNMTWANPTDDRLYADEKRQRPTAVFKNIYTKNYGYDHVNHYNKLVEMTQKYIVGNKGFHKIIYGAKPILYAGEVLGVPQYDPEQEMDLYRDYTHLSDFGQLIVAYQWYAQVCGLEDLKEVKVDVIPAAQRARAAQRALGDLEITPKHKAIIMEAVNETLKDPFTIPCK